ncbi:MAG: ComF family protein [Ruminococcus sp.]|nr:ComF family protein [Ruminococcus sp.]
MKHETLRQIAALIYPSRCPVCNDIIGANDCFCPKCSEILVRYEGSFHIRGSSGFVAAYEYRPDMSEAVMLMKRGTMGNAPYAFGSAIAERLAEAGMNSAELLVPVPMYRSDLHRRGGNQSRLIAEVVGRKLGICVDSGAVIKSTETLPQKELRKHEREVNMRGAFTVRKPEAVFGKKIILIDDICTTGSTLTELTSVLLSAGAAEVCCACACKTVGRYENEQGEQI